MIYLYEIEVILVNGVKLKAIQNKTLSCLFRWEVFQDSFGLFRLFIGYSDG